jgi:hypothetical protein
VRINMCESGVEVSLLKFLSLVGTWFRSSMYHLISIHDGTQCKTSHYRLMVMGCVVNRVLHQVALIDVVRLDLLPPLKCDTTGVFQNIKKHVRA